MFHTFAALHMALGKLLKELNNRAFRHYHPGSSRQTRFGALDRPALTALLRYRYEYTDIRRAKMGPDYNVLYQRHAYSVPHALVCSHIDDEAGARLIRLYHRGQRVLQHPKALKDGGFTTPDEHMPDSHRHQRWSPERLLSWGESIGSATRTVVAWHLNERKHLSRPVAAAWGCCRW